MNTNSKICIFINEHKDNWKELLTENKIKIKEEHPYVIFNYDINCNFSEPIVQEARGIIINIETLDVVCWPFRKFGNHNESYADKIDWNTARVQDKIDGSIMKLWWSKVNNEWVISTNGVIYAQNAIANVLTDETFYYLFKKADNYKDLRFDELNKDYTYIFELVSPKTQVVVKYSSTYLYHIGTKNNITGKELNIDINIEKPKEYVLNSLDDCIEAANKLNYSEDNSIHNVNKEGFVVVDANWNRIKVKSPEYLILHKISSNNNFSKERIIDMIRNKKVDLNDLCENFPNFAHYFKYYDFKITEFFYQAKVFCDLTDEIYEEYSYERKAVANIIKDHRLSSIAFKHLSMGKTSKELLEELTIQQFCRFIPDYEPERLSKIFWKR